jgi:hypothetical protein
VQLTGDLFFIDHDDHPDADFLVAAQQRRAVDPAGLAFDVSLDAAEPGDLCGDACAVRKGIEESLTHTFRSADAFEEFGLEEAGDSKGGGCERNTEGWVGADEEVLWSGIVSWSCFSSWSIRRTITYVLIHSGQATGMPKARVRPEVAIRGRLVVHA